MIEFKAWPKTARFTSGVVITEKIDGSNCAIHIVDTGDYLFAQDFATQSRNRIITPDDDHQGFAAWAYSNKELLESNLGLGTHFGEWTTKGLKTPKFFLFNTHRWANVDFNHVDLACVPVLYEGRYYEGLVQEQLDALEAHGSYAYDAPPEGVVIYWKADNSLKKAYCSNTPKSRGNV